MNFDSTNLRWLNTLRGKFLVIETKWKTQKKVQLLRSEYLFNEFNGWLEVHAEINECPNNTFPFVFFLFQNEHKMIEILLQSFVRVINAKLLKTIKLYNFDEM